MKTILSISLVCILFMTNLNAQVINKTFNATKPIAMTSNFEIDAQDLTTTIVVDVIYNAVPDGYLLTYTTTFIGKNIEDVELKANKRMDDLILAINPLKVLPSDVTVDIISLDPIFDFNKSDSISPSGYRITQNITINFKDINSIGKLTKICLEYGIYDLTNAQAYVLNTDKIHDSLDLKAVEILNQKKKLCENVGVSLSGGKIHFNNFKDVYYPSEKYLKSYISNSTYFSHNASQNSSINLQRKVDVDNYYDYNLKNADFVFNSNNNEPVIQFYTQLQYVYKKVDTEDEIREKIRKEEEKKPSKEFYMINEKGELVKIATQ